MAERKAVRSRKLARAIARPLEQQQRLGAQLIALLAADFVQHGARIIGELREANPTNYLRLIASLRPKELHDEDTLDGIPDGELLEAISMLRALAAAHGADGAAAEREGRAEPPRELPPLS